MLPLEAHRQPDGLRSPPAAPRCQSAYLRRRVLQIRQSATLSPSTSANTIVTKERFLAELALVANRGYAVDNEEFEEGLRCIAAPVRDHSHDVAGAISIAGPTFRVTGSRLPALSREVKRVAAELSTALGYRSVAAMRSGR